jgi:hypothetical protein
MRLISCALFALVIFSSTTCPAFAKRSGAGISDGKTVSIDYTMKVDGQVVDSTEQRGAVTYVQGQGQMMPGLEKGVYGLKPGDTKTVKVSPEEGYGEINPSAVVDVPRGSEYSTRHDHESRNPGWRQPCNTYRRR